MHNQIIDESYFAAYYSLPCMRNMLANFCINMPFNYYGLHNIILFTKLNERHLNNFIIIFRNKFLTIRTFCSKVRS